MDSLTAIGEWMKALETYGQYGKIGFEPEPEDKLRLGRLQLEIGNLERALRLLNETETAGVSPPELYIWKGRVLAELGRNANAEAAFQKAVELSPDMIVARIERVKYYLDQKQTQAAWVELDAVSHLDIIDLKVAEIYTALVDSLKKL